jgi:predicted AlkP superfamily phosphohydrolase/phosphomutase
LIRKAQTSASSATVVDINRSRAYCVPIYDYIFGIRLNLEGDEKETLHQQIVQALEGVTDPETNQPIVQRVLRGEEYYHGPYADSTPDIIVIMDPNYGCGYRLGLYSSIATEVQFHEGRGDHRMEGIFIANGPNIVSGTEALPGLNIEDIAPTVLYLMGHPVPTNMDGRVLTGIVPSPRLVSQPVSYGNPIGFWPKEDKLEFYDEVMSDEDEKEIRERLQALGYLE